MYAMGKTLTILGRGVFASLLSKMHQRQIQHVIETGRIQPSEDREDFVFQVSLEKIAIINDEKEDLLLKGVSEVS